MINEKENKELIQLFASLKDGFEKLVEASKPKTDVKDEQVTKEDLHACMAAMYAMVDNCHKRISNMQGDFYDYANKHQVNHPYPLLTATHKEKYLKATGMENDYEKPQKKWANASKTLFKAE